MSNAPPKTIVRFHGQGGHQPRLPTLGRPFVVELRPRAVIRIAVKIAVRVTRNAWHSVGFDALCVIRVLPEPVLVPAPLHDWMHTVVSQPQTVRPEEGVLLISQSSFDQFTTIDHRLAAKLLLDPSQELSRLVEGHCVSTGALVIKSNQRVLIRFGVVKKILYLLCDIS